jgi:hypothetical protein
MELKIGKLYQLGYPMRLNTCHPLDGDMKLIEVLQISSLVVLLDTLDMSWMLYVKLLSSQGRVGWCQYYKTLPMLEEIS